MKNGGEREAEKACREESEKEEKSTSGKVQREPIAEDLSIMPSILYLHLLSRLLEWLLLPLLVHR